MIFTKPHLKFPSVYLMSFSDKNTNITEKNVSNALSNNLNWLHAKKLSLNPTQNGGKGQKGPPTSFSPVTSTNLGISSQNFPTFSFKPLPHLCKFQRHTYCQSQIIELEPRLPLKKIVFSGQVLIKLRL